MAKPNVPSKTKAEMDDSMVSDRLVKIKEYTIELTTDLLGTVAKDPDVYKTYIESKKPEGIEEDESANVEKIETKGWTGFHMDENGIFIYDYMIKGFLKHAANVMKDNLKLKNLRSKIADRVFIAPRKIYMGQHEPDGVFERPLRAMTMQGPRVSLSRSDYINAGKQITFKIKWLENKEINEKLIDTLFEYGELQGLGQFRGGNFGSFRIIATS